MGLVYQHGEMYCESCGTVGYPIEKSRGQLYWVFVLFFLCFAIPGLVYLVWRWTHKKLCCPNCDRSTLIPASSPAAKAAIRPVPPS